MFEVKFNDCLLPALGGSTVTDEQAERDGRSYFALAVAPLENVLVRLSLLTVCAW